MSYKLKEITIRMDNTVNSKKKLAEIWEDVESGKIPILFNSQHQFQQGISPISKYSNYSKENGDYDFSIMGVKVDFFKQIEAKVIKKLYKKYDASNDDGDINVCSQKAWDMVNIEQNSGEINRAYTVDYESSVPAEYTKDGKAHCYLYISIK